MGISVAEPFFVWWQRMLEPPTLEPPRAGAKGERPAPLKLRGQWDWMKSQHRLLSKQHYQHYQRRR
jgi:hypothetical protein